MLIIAGFRDIGRSFPCYVHLGGVRFAQGNDRPADQVGAGVSQRTSARAFYQGSGHKAQIQEAKAVCQKCDVMTACLKFALESGQDSGVWGGLSEDERRSLKRRNARARRAS